MDDFGPPEIHQVEQPIGPRERRRLRVPRDVAVFTIINHPGRLEDCQRRACVAARAV